MNVRDVPIPPSLAHLPLDTRGYPIFEMIVRDASGKAHFAVNDELKRQKIIKEERCSLCGKPLLRARWLVGGPLSSFTENGAYLDPPMHHECMTYALKVCPYLAAPRWSSQGIGLAAVTGADFDGKRPAFREDEQSIKRRPDVFVAVKYVGQHYVKGDVNPVTAGRTDIPENHPLRQIGVLYIKPKLPYREIEFWRQGEKITREEGALLASQSMNTDLAAMDAEIVPSHQETAP